MSTNKTHDSLSAQPSPGGQVDALEHAKNLDLLRAGYRVDYEPRTAALNAAIAALAARQPVGEPVEMSPEFTDTARAAIAWVLWHHQGGSSPVGQPLRFSLGMGQHDRMTDQQIAEAKRFAAWAGATTEGFHRHKTAQAVDLGQQQDATRYQFLRSKLATGDLPIILSRNGSEVDAADYVDSEIDKVMRNG
ncbi:hypothetical protein [Stenotrophomonas muris]|uniref:hypothetical protein n=1 Tax=Stenotrophomonas muris TaxID=2963283 RepID=UPI0039C60879